MERKIKKCIDKYLTKYHLYIEVKYTEDEIGYDGDIRLFKKDIKTPAGKLHFSIHKKTKELGISEVYVRLKDKPTVKLFKIFLLRLIYMFIDEVETIFLEAPNKKRRKGLEFCLICYYQTLGFVPVNYDAKKMVNKCKKELKKINKLEDETHDYCVLCSCQKLNIPEDKFLDSKIDLAFWTVDMRAILKNMEPILNEVYLELDC